MSSMYLHPLKNPSPQQIEIDRAMITQWFQLCRGVQQNEPITVGMVRHETESGNILMEVTDSGYNLVLSPSAFIELQKALNDDH